VPDFGVGGGGDGLAALAAEDPAVRADAVFLDVVSEELDQDGRDGDRADVVGGAVLEAAFLVGVSGVGPLPVDLGTGLGEGDLAPAGWR
jgi:hypothetical protein